MLLSQAAGWLHMAAAAAVLIVVVHCLCLALQRPLIGVLSSPTASPD